MSGVTWAEGISAVGSIATPLVVLGFGIAFSHRQTRNDELLKARVQFYKDLAPDLNTLMCYMTFIGTWRDHSPIEIIHLKRRLDKTFFCAAPLFSNPVQDAYSNLTSACFATFNAWGSDALIRSGAFRRREAWRGEEQWNRAWDRMFTKDESEPIPAEELTHIRSAHDQLIAALVRDLDLTRARSQYTTTLVALNAHAPVQRDVTGRE